MISTPSSKSGAAAGRLAALSVSWRSREGVATTKPFHLRSHASLTLNVVLPDPQGRAPRGIVLIVYDAGGHDEYQEMQQVFVTTDTLYILLWNVAKRPVEGQDERAFQREMVSQQVQWAQIIQSCAPGSTVRI